eukprot:g172.t1
MITMEKISGPAEPSFTSDSLPPRPTVVKANRSKPCASRSNPCTTFGCSNFVTVALLKLFPTHTWKRPGSLRWTCSP